MLKKVLIVDGEDDIRMITEVGLDRTAIGVLAKPFNPAELARGVRQLLMPAIRR